MRRNRIVGLECWRHALIYAMGLAMWTPFESLFSFRDVCCRLFGCDLTLLAMSRF